MAAASGVLVLGAAQLAGEGTPLWQRMAAHPSLALVASLLFVLTIVAVQFPLPVRPGKKVTVTAAVHFATLLLLPFPSAPLLVGAGHLAGLILRTAREPQWRSLRRLQSQFIAFNASEALLAYGLGRLVFERLEPAGDGPLGHLETLWAIPAAAAVVYLTNSLLVSGMVALQKRRRFTDVWLPGRGEDTIQFVGLYATGLVAALAAEHYPWALLIMLLPALMIYLSLKRTVELARQTQAALETMQQLQQQREELAQRVAEAAALHELDRTKNELITTISHELRTPITVIHGYAQLLKSRRGVVEPRKLEALAQAVYSNSTQLQRLVQDLVDVGRVERGTFTLETEAFDLTSVLEEVVAGTRARAGGERVALEPTDALPLYADRARVVQVVSNLVENALKYAPDSPIVLRARGTTGAVRVEVEDHGPGIPRDEQQRVWEKFFRCSDVVRHNLQRGTGIGLSLVKALVEAQGGRVGLECPDTGGATFWFELPTPQGAAVPIHLPTQTAPLNAA
ncbi:MAG TPA: ATP-binding protein [Chloroflexota bacterium]|nr:ATP-binding protein [Chloroflexota bacterium]